MIDKNLPHKSGLRSMFDNLIFAADEDITLPTAAALARELGFTDYDPQNYDH